MMMAIDASKIVSDLTLMIEEHGESTFVRARDVLNQLFAAKIVPQEKSQYTKKSSARIVEQV